MSDHETAAASILDDEEVTLTADTTADEVIELLSRADAQREKPECGIVWTFQHEPGEFAPALLVGVRGDVGALAWFTATDALVPADGDREEFVDYFTRYGHHQVMSAEIPRRLVESAFREFVRTRTRPTVVEWRDR